MHVEHKSRHLSSLYSQSSSIGNGIDGAVDERSYSIRSFRDKLFISIFGNYWDGESEVKFSTLSEIPAAITQ